MLLVVAGASLAVAFGAARPAGAETAHVQPICFPVVEPVHFTSSFGAPRSGHRHQGNDLMGGKGFHLVAAADGVVVDLRGPGQGYSGHSIRIQGVDRWFYSYLHMNDDNWGTDDGSAPVELVFAPGLAVGSPVLAGQFIGYMGDSGNAEGSGAHLHFEIRQPADNLWSAQAIDPHASLLAAPRCQDPTAVPPEPPRKPVMPSATRRPTPF
ncbi:MAG: M23 family metallopeptidase [Acidimicrobiales bacterium]